MEPASGAAAPTPGPRRGGASRHRLVPDSPPQYLQASSDTVVRRVRQADAEAFARAVGESLDHLRPWMPWATPAAAEVAMQRNRMVAADATWADGTAYEYAVLTGDGKRLIGGCGLMRRVGPRALDIGYWVHAGYIRRGHATAAAGALTEAAWTLPDTERVEIHCDEANVASAGVPARLGYRLDRTVPSEISAPGETGRRMVWVIERDRWRRTGADSA